MLHKPGGQGLATANNARFLGYLEGTPQAREISALRERWTASWLADPRIKAEFLRLVVENGGDARRPTANIAAWEACVEPLKTQFNARAQLGIRKTDLYRVVPASLIASDEDFQFAWQARKAELLATWQNETVFDGFWAEAELLHGAKGERKSLRRVKSVSDSLFCQLCQELLSWWQQENERRRSQRPRRDPIPRRVIGLRSSEDYCDPDDAPRVASIYNGLSGHGRWVPFRKGDPEGHRWLDDNPLYIDWSDANVDWLFENSGRRAPNMPVVRNPHLYLVEGISWTRGANHVAVKSRLQPACVFDANGLRLTPMNHRIVSPPAFLALMNSAVFSYFLKKFVDHTWMVQISDVRMMPIVVPNRNQAHVLAELAQQAMKAKRLIFSGETPPNDLVAFVNRWSKRLKAAAPAYLRPPAQQLLLATAADCLDILELAVDWEAEKLYGVEGMGPFDEF